MTSGEKEIAMVLMNEVTMLPGSFDKKFTRQLGNWADRDMTPEGRVTMIHLVQKYRVQIKDYQHLISKISIP